MTRFKIPRWPFYFLKWMLGITLAGAVLGAIIFPLVGLIFETGYTPSQLVMNGVKTLGFFFGIWAPGTALVLTVKKVYEAKKAGDLPEEETSESSA
ncbi:hypothetical protein [Actomonas aquatica]|uniref:Uncharacterized protein n=1 Tax=Actomonas aquatica TaxID=2866162 RepID=A0ABZ1CC43_9BACT|nr:hypothetical protein [Opitutus sp. WL0086]WRQ89248.1 hypothetical protein K1X11_007495 [Opitutus sp. WL0086]